MQVGQNKVGKNLTNLQKMTEQDRYESQMSMLEVCVCVGGRACEEASMTSAFSGQRDRRLRHIWS